MVCTEELERRRALPGFPANPIATACADKLVHSGMVVLSGAEPWEVTNVHDWGGVVDRAGLRGLLEGDRGLCDPPLVRSTRAAIGRAGAEAGIGRRVEA